MKSRAGAIINAGGVPLATTNAPPGDPAQYGFESGAQSWTSTGSAVSSVTRSTDRAFAGGASLRVAFGASSGDGFVKVLNPAVSAGRTVTFHVWVPGGTTLTAIQPYVLQGATGGWAWTGSWRAASALQAGNWNTLTVQVPASAAALAELGVVFSLSGASTGSAYVDSIAY
jgi:hypothetical protein